MRGRTYLIYFSATIAGIYLGRYIGPISLLALAIGALVCMLIRTGGHRRPDRALPCAFAIIGSLTILLAGSAQSGALLARSSQRYSTVRIEGRIISNPETESMGTTLFIRARKARINDTEWSTDETVYAFVEGRLVQDKFFQGVTVACSGRLAPVGPDERWIWDRGAGSKMSMSSRSMTLISPGADPVSAGIARTRRWLSKAYGKIFDNRTAGFVEGVTISKLDTCDEGVLADLRACGLSHIVAVSGLHVGSAAMLVLALGALVGAGRRTRYTAAVLAAIAMTALASFRVSALRASIMAASLFMGAVSGRRHVSLAALSFAGIALLWLNPRAAFDSSFHYSFAASAGIIIFSAAGGKGVRGRLGNAVAICAGAQLGTIPILLFRGEPVPVSAIAANALVIWLVGPLIVSAAASAAMSAVCLGPAKVVAAVPCAISRFMMWTAAAFAKMPGAGLFMGIAGALSLALYGYALIGLARKAGGGSMFKPAIALGVSALIVLLSCFPIVWQGDGACMVAMDVGEGDATLLRDGAGATVLVDGGPDPDVLLRRLRSRRVSKLDIVICSHPHADHAGGLSAAIRVLPVGRFVVSESATSDEEFANLIAEAKNRGARMSVAKSGDVMRLTGDLEIEILQAPEAVDSRENDRNNASLACMATIYGAKVLLPGDLEAPALSKLMAEHSDLRCDVLKIPHHGSANASDVGFLKAVSPDVATISAGKGNRLGHPSIKCLRDLESCGIRSVRTDLSGDIVIRFEKGGFSVEEGR